MNIIVRQTLTQVNLAIACIHLLESASSDSIGVDEIIVNNCAVILVSLIIVLALRILRQQYLHYEPTILLHHAASPSTGFRMKIIRATMVCVSILNEQSIIYIKYINYHILRYYMYIGLDVLEKVHVQRLTINALHLDLRAWRGTMTLDYKLDVSSLLEGKTSRFYSSRAARKIYSLNSLFKYICFHIKFLFDVCICINVVTVYYIVFFNSFCFHKLCTQLRAHNRGTLLLCKTIWKGCKLLMIGVIVSMYLVMTNPWGQYGNLGLFSNIKA